MKNLLEKSNEIELAKQILKDNGFFVDNLWHIIDVKDMYECTDEQAMKVLEGALTNEAVFNQIWDAIDSKADDCNLINKLNNYRD